MYYLVFITFGLCVTYLLLYYLFPLLLGNKTEKLRLRSVLSMATIIGVSVIGFYVVFSLPDGGVGNRVLHGFNGGFVALLTCYLAVNDSRTKINKFQFFILSMLFVTALGVANELLEFYLQSNYDINFMPNRYDVWYDLTSNTIGGLVGSLLFTNFVGRNK